jgi:hypothetical protein
MTWPAGGGGTTPSLVRGASMSKTYSLDGSSSSGRVARSWRGLAGLSADLAAAQQNSPALAEMRGGAVMTDHELTWLAVGALIVILVLVI